jgi:hypothetical protein
MIGNIQSDDANAASTRPGMPSQSASISQRGSHEQNRRENQANSCEQRQLYNHVQGHVAFEKDPRQPKGDPDAKGDERAAFHGAAMRNAAAAS